MNISRAIITPQTDEETQPPLGNYDQGLGYLLKQRQRSTRYPPATIWLNALERKRTHQIKTSQEFFDSIIIAGRSKEQSPTDSSQWNEWWSNHVQQQIGNRFNSILIPDFSNPFGHILHISNQIPIRNERPNQLTNCWILHLAKNKKTYSCQIICRPVKVTFCVYDWNLGQNPETVIHPFQF